MYVLNKVRRKGNTSDEARNRDKEIISLFKDMRRSMQYSGLYQICKAISTCSVSRHYLSYETAKVILKRYNSSGVYPEGEGYRRRLYRSFIKNCERIRRIKPYISADDMIWDALYSKADCCGISPNRIYRVLKKGGFIYANA